MRPALACLLMLSVSCAGKVLTPEQYILSGEPSLEVRFPSSIAIAGTLWVAIKGSADKFTEPVVLVVIAGDNYDVFWVNPHVQRIFSFTTRFQNPPTAMLLRVALCRIKGFTLLGQPIPWKCYDDKYKVILAETLAMESVDHPPVSASTSLRPAWAPQHGELCRIPKSVGQGPLPSQSPSG